MDKKIAGEIAEEKLREILASDKARIVNLLTEDEYELLTKEGVEYQIRPQAFYEDKTKKIIRVCVLVDDMGFWSTFRPLSRCELVSGETYKRVTLSECMDWHEYANILADYLCDYRDKKGVEAEELYKLVSDSPEFVPEDIVEFITDTVSEVEQESFDETVVALQKSWDVKNFVKFMDSPR